MVDYVATLTCSYARFGMYQSFIQGFLKGGEARGRHDLASTFGRPEMSHVPFEQVLDIFKIDKLNCRLAYSKEGGDFPPLYETLCIIPSP